MKEDALNELNSRFLSAPDAGEALAFALAKYRGGAVFSTSLGAEDQVLTDLIVRADRSVAFATLDTGRLPPETYNVLAETEKHFGIRIEVLFPDYTAVEAMVRNKGVNLFYDSIENRKECCAVRKLEPLSRALKNKTLWITGLRKEQSVTRSDMQFAEWDDKYSIMKINPLLNWTEKDVWDYIRDKKIPYNELHDKGYPSIGCAPCTRAVSAGEDSRAGRWWWENPETKECGLHMKDGKLVRVKS